jgi:hypothetical protein
VAFRKAAILCTVTSSFPEGPGGPVGARSETQVVERIRRRVRRIFASLDVRPYLDDADRQEFRYYADIFDDDLQAIERKVEGGRLRPLDLGGFPQIMNYPAFTARIGVFIGSFDPFQMSHLATALHFLASEESQSDVVFVVPEGGANPAKPNKSEYRFRYELLRLQIEGIFSPFVVPLDIGENADTIGIIERLIGFHAGARLSLTHLLGSDSLPTAVLLLPEDLAVWRARAAERCVEFDHGLFVALRGAEEDIEPYAQAVRALGLRFVLDRRVVGTPSSSDFRSKGHITIVFPTEAVLERLQLLFRYSMNRPWMGLDPKGESHSDYEI